MNGLKIYPRESKTMRLWHYKLITFLPKSQLIAQWRELNSIFKKQNKHILINYVYEYPKEDLFTYTYMILQELYNRNVTIKNWRNYDKYFADFRGQEKYHYSSAPFSAHHNNRYLLQCFYNLQEKFDRNQKDFDVIDYFRLCDFMTNYFKETRFN